jgi:hypothetical protein
MIPPNGGTMNERALYHQKSGARVAQGESTGQSADNRNAVGVA